MSGYLSWVLYSMIHSYYITWELVREEKNIDKILWCFMSYIKTCDNVILLAAHFLRLHDNASKMIKLLMCIAQILIIGKHEIRKWSLWIKYSINWVWSETACKLQEILAWKTLLPNSSSNSGELYSDVWIASKSIVKFKNCKLLTIFSRLALCKTTACLKYFSPFL